LVPSLKDRRGSVKAAAREIEQEEKSRVLCEGIVGIFRLFRERWREPGMRKKVCYLMAGKMIGLGIVLLLISKWYMPAPAYADVAPPLPPPHINAINTVWPT
jgi:hypothetical protein